MKPIGKISFTVRDLELDFKKISSNIKNEPTKVIKKGQQLKASRIAKFDIWRIEKEYYTISNIPEVLEKLLNELNESQDFIYWLKNEYEYVGITCYVVTEFGQIGISIPSSLIQMLNFLDMGIEFDIISYGGVED